MALTRPRYSQIYDTDYKQSVRLATTTDVGNLAVTGSTVDEVDGVTVAVGDRILVKNQSDDKQNGIYEVLVVGTGSNGTWRRALDADANDKVTSGLTTVVTAGSINANKTFRLTTADPITLGVSSLTFIDPFSAAAAGGANTAVQFNDAGTLAGDDAGFAYFKGNDTIRVGNVRSASGIYSDSYYYANGAPFVSSNYGNTDVAAFLIGYGGNVLASTISANNFNYTNGVSILDAVWSNLSTVTGSLANLTANAAAQAGLISAAEGNIVTANTAMKGYVDGEVITLNNAANLYLANLTGATFTGILSVANTTQSTGPSTGAFQVSGGAYIDKNLYIGGNLFVSGNTTTLNTNNLTISDSIIFLSNNNLSDIVDIGTVGHYTQNSVLYHTGFVRDASDGFYKLFSNVSQDVTTTVDFTNAVYSNLKIGVLNSSNIVANTGLITGNLIVNAIRTNNYLLENGDPIPSYGNTNVLYYLEQEYLPAIGTNLIPATSNTITLGNINYLWSEIWVANAGLYIGNTPISVAGNTILINGNPITAGSTYSNSNVASYLTVYNGDIAADDIIAQTVTANALTVNTTVTVDYLIANIADFTGNVVFSNVFALNYYYSNGESLTFNISNTLNSLTANAAIQAGDIATLYANAAIQAGDIATLYANAAIQAGDITTLFANAATQTTLLSLLEANAAVQAGELATLTANAASQAGAISELYTIKANLASPTFTGNIATGGILTNNYFYANGAPISFYGNTEVSAYLAASSNIWIDSGNIRLNTTQFADQGIYGGNPVFQVRRDYGNAVIMEAAAGQSNGPRLTIRWSDFSASTYVTAEGLSINRFNGNLTEYKYGQTVISNWLGNITIANATGVYANSIYADGYFYSNGQSIFENIDNALTSLTSNAATQAGAISSLEANAAVQAGAISDLYTIKANLSGATFTGNVTAPNLTVTGTFTTNSFVTSGTQGSGNITGVNHLDAISITTTGNITAPYFLGNVVTSTDTGITMGGKVVATVDDAVALAIALG